MDILILFIICAGLQFFLPWWTMTIAAFAVGSMMMKSAKSSFARGFIAIAMLWTVVAAIKYTTGAEIIATRVAPIVKMPHPSIVILVTGIIGGLVAGIACLSGYQLKEAMASEK